MKKIIDQLNIIQHKGACQYTLHKGDNAMSKIKSLLPIEDYNKLSIARSHYLIGEGADELMDVVKELQLKYST